MDNFSFIEKNKEFQKFCKLGKDKLSHAYLVISPDELTNITFSKLMAMKINCDSICKNCENCVKIIADNHPDVLSFPKGKNFVVEDASSIVAGLDLAPMLAEKKVYILNNINKATIIAQNKLLKAIEEPPKNVIFILNTTSTSSVLPTILSRVQKIEVSPFSKNEIANFLENKNVQLDEDVILQGEGYLGKTLSLSTDVKFKECCNLVQDILTNMKSSRDVLKFSVKFAEKENFAIKLEILENEFDKILSKVISGENKEYTECAVAEIFEKINLAKKELLANCNINLISDNLLMGILEVKYLCK